MAANPSAGECGVEDQVGRAGATHLTQVELNRVEFYWIGRNRTGRGIADGNHSQGTHMTVPARFRQHAAAKLAKIEKLDQKAMRSTWRSPKNATRGSPTAGAGRADRSGPAVPAIRAEAAADDATPRWTWPSQTRLAAAASRDRRKVTTGQGVGAAAGQLARAAGHQPDAGAGPPRRPRGGPLPPGRRGRLGAEATRAATRVRPSPSSGLMPIQMEGDGPLVVREKVHTANPMTIEQALLEMELVGHDFYLFHDRDWHRQRRLPPPWLRLRSHPPGRGGFRQSPARRPLARAAMRPGPQGARLASRPWVGKS